MQYISVVKVDNSVMSENSARGTLTTVSDTFAYFHSLVKITSVCFSTNKGKSLRSKHLRHTLNRHFTTETRVAYDNVLHLACD